MQFKPKTDEELALAGLWADGEYNFEVVGAEDKISKSSGNEMIELELKFHDQGATKTVKSYITATQEFRLKSAAYCMGLGAQYETGTLGAGHFIGKKGRATLKTEPANGDFKAKNGVNEFIPATTQAPISAHDVAKGNAYQPDNGAPF